jgi:hypothetical protein
VFGSLPRFDHRDAAPQILVSEISRLLGDKCGLEISHSAIHNFVRLNPLQRRESAIPQDSVERSDRRRENVRAELTGNGGLVPPSDEVRERIATMKRRPALACNEKVTFQFDPDQPLRLDNGEF